jgi:hypothetical protein
MAEVPDSISDLQGQLFQIRACDDLRPYNKLVHSLEAYPDAFIVTVDDDVVYDEDCIERLLAAYDPMDPTIVCHRAHRVTYLEDGSLAPYREWERRVHDPASELSSDDLMPTGVGGVLYPPGSLPPETMDRALIARLSPTCDDSWFFFMRRQGQWKVKRAPGKSPQPLVWPNTQDKALHKLHKTGRKDEQLRALAGHFGIPGRA